MTPAAQRAKEAIARGDLITAYDEALSAIEDGDASNEVRHQLVLALARMGDTDRAMELFEQYGLDRSNDPHEQAVGARLLKDRALALQPGEEREAALRAAASAYYMIFAGSSDSYPGINAASLAALSGQEDKARTIASEILADPEVARPDNYYTEATRAEALLLLGRSDESAQSLLQAARMMGNDHGARSTTCRQMKLLARHIGLHAEAIDALLAPVQPARVMHFCGHIFAADNAVEAALREQISAMLDAEDIGFAYGALAAGADIVAAEAALARGAELHAVLPFSVEHFIEQSLRPAGEGWVERFEACWEAASSRTLATEMGYVGDPTQFSYCSHVAMGLSKLRAQHLGNAPVQLAIWDGVETEGPAGTGPDVAAWRGQGGRSVVIAPEGADRGYPRPAGPEGELPERALAAIIFTDFPGFSKLAEEVLPVFWNGVMRHVGEVLEDHGEKVLMRNSWGDALYAVASSAGAAADIALELQAKLSDFDYSRLGMERGDGMRIGAHFGPAYREYDHITGQMNFYGTEVSRAARIEPVTPPGAVFVTEPFAAILTLEEADRFRCRYVGRIELAKGYGTYPMYMLTRR